MDGQWAIEFKERNGGGLSAHLVKGPVSAEAFSDGDRVELVPCDDAAIMRAVHALGVIRQLGPLAAESRREIAEAVLRAAGEVGR